MKLAKKIGSLFLAVTISSSTFFTTNVFASQNKKHTVTFNQGNVINYSLFPNLPKKQKWEIATVDKNNKSTLLSDLSYKIAHNSELEIPNISLMGNSQEINQITIGDNWNNKTSYNKAFDPNTVISKNLVGWNVKDEYGNTTKISKDQKYTVTSDVKLTALWEDCNTHTATYLDSDNKPFAVHTISENDDKNWSYNVGGLQPNNPDKENYIHIGWSLTPNGNNIEGSNIKLDENKTFYPIFVKTPYVVLKYQDKNNKSILPDIQYHCPYDEINDYPKPGKTTITLKKAPNIKNYTFKGWKIDNKLYKVGAKIEYTWNDEIIETWKKNNYTPAKKTIIAEAMYKKNKEIRKQIVHSITFKKGIINDELAKNWYIFNLDNINKVNDNDTFTLENLGHIISYNENSRPVGYNHIGWYANGDTKNILTGNIKITKNTILTAVWDKCDMKTITYVYENGETYIKKRTCKHKDYNFQIDTNLKLEKQNHTFLGWNTDKNATEAVNQNIKVSEDINLYPIFKENPKYTVTYDEVGETYSTYETNQYVIEDIKHTKTNHTFIGWSTEKNGEIINIIPISKDTTLYPVFKKNNNFTITYDDKNSKTFYANTVDGDVIGTLKSKPIGEKENHIFKGWEICDTTFQADEKIPLTENLTATAVWEAQKIDKVVINISKKSEKNFAPGWWIISKIYMQNPYYHRTFMWPNSWNGKKWIRNISKINAENWNYEITNLKIYTSNFFKRSPITVPVTKEMGTIKDGVLTINV